MSDSRNARRAPAREALAAAMAAHQAGRLAEADGLYRQAIQADPGDARALRLRGILARERGDLAASRRYLGRAAEVAPADPAPLCELATTAMAADDLTGAVRHLRAALGRDAGHARSRANLGALLQYRGHVVEAIACHQDVLARDPRDVEVRCNLARALVEAGRGEEALAACDAGLALDPSHPLLLATRGAVLCDLERYDAAIGALEGAVVRFPDDDTAWVSLAYARARLGRHELAIEALVAARRVNPDSGRATADLVNLLAGTGRRDEALGLAADFLAMHPGERHMLAAQGFALRDAGRGAEADGLLDSSSLVRVVDCNAPPGFADLAAFNARLRRVIEADASLVASPASKSTRGGFQTGELDLAAGPVLEGLSRMFDEAVAGFAADLRRQGFGAHPAMAPAAARRTLRAWGVALEAGGRQVPHIHPHGWLSGVYYVDLPAGMAGEPAQAGWLEFGAPPDRFLVSAAPVTRAVEPRAGRLVLFPSYFYHRTLPFAAAGRRISIAFDVVKKGTDLFSGGK